MIGGVQLAAGAAVLALVGGLAGWGWIERNAAADLRERAVAAERAASDARAAAVANAQAAVWLRQVAEAAQEQAAQLERTRGEIRTRVVTYVREIRREEDAQEPVGPTLRRAAQRLRELDAATRPAAAGADPAAPARGAAGDPGPPAPAR